jgi:flagellar basal body-associated protein FliL
MAKEQKPPESAPAPDAAPEVVGPPKSYRLQILLGFVCLVLFQTIVLAVVVSTLVKKEPVTPGVSQRDMPIDYDTPSIVPEDIGKGEKFVERTIGEKAFKVKVPDGENQTTFSVAIHIKIRAKDAPAFDKRYQECVHEVEDRINIVLTSSTDKERVEAATTTIKEKIKKEVNRVLETPWVLQVLLTDFSYENN